MADTLEKIGSILWDGALSTVQSVVNTPSIGEKTYAQALQAILDLSNSPFANSTMAANLASLAGNLVSYAPPEQLAYGQAGQDMATTISGILKLANDSSADLNDEATSSSTSSRAQLLQADTSGRSNASSRCTTIDGAVSLANSFLQRAGQAMQPGEEATVFNASEFSGEARMLFGDTKTGTMKITARASSSSTTRNPVVALPEGFAAPEASSSAASSSSLFRPRAVLAVATYRSIDSCRKEQHPGIGQGGMNAQSRGGQETTGSAAIPTRIFSEVVSITVKPTIDDSGNSSSSSGSSGSSSTTHFQMPQGRSVFLGIPVDIPREIEPVADSMCKASQGRGGGKTTSSPGANAGFSRDDSMQVDIAQAYCNYWEEAQQRYEECGEDKSTDNYAIYGAFAAICAAIMTFAGIQYIQIDIPGKYKSYIGLGHVFVFMQCLARTLTCALYGNFLPGFTFDSVGAGGRLVISAVPYSFSYWTFSFLIFQWYAITHNKGLSRTPFKRVQKWWVMSNVLATSLVWATLAYAVFDKSKESYIVGTCVVALIFLTFAVTSLLYGFQLYRMVACPEGHGPQKNAASRRRNEQATHFMRVAVLVFSCFLMQMLMNVFASAFYEQGDVVHAMTAVHLAAGAVAALTILMLYYGAVNNALGKKKFGSRSSGASSVRSGMTSNSVQMSVRSSNKMLDSMPSMPLQQRNTRFVKVEQKRGENEIGGMSPQRDSTIGITFNRVTRSGSRKGEYTSKC
eukprot:jgi/Bigna1/141968/aug1.66_g16676